jgi:hypothetical protein
MRYFTLSQDDNITDMPHPADFHDKLDVRNLTPQKAAALPERTFVRLVPNTDMVFPEILCSPVFLVTEEAKDIMKSYDKYLTYKQIVYTDHVNDHLCLYHMPVLDAIDCFERYEDESAKYAENAKIVIRRAPIRDKSIFHVPGAKRRLTIIRLDLAESFLARNYRGFRLTEATVVN